MMEKAKNSSDLQRNDLIKCCRELGWKWCSDDYDDDDDDNDDDDDDDDDDNDDDDYDDDDDHDN